MNINPEINKENVIPLNVSLDSSCPMVIPWSNDDKTKYITPNGYGRLCFLHGFHVRAGAQGEWTITIGVEDIGEPTTLRFTGPEGETHEIKGIPAGLCGCLSTFLAINPELMHRVIEHGLYQEVCVAAQVYRDKKK